MKHLARSQDEDEDDNGDESDEDDDADDNDDDESGDSIEHDPLPFKDERDMCTFAECECVGTHFDEYVHSRSGNHTVYNGARDMVIVNEKKCGAEVISIIRKMEGVIVNLL